MNFLITGGTGFVGTELIPFLLDQGHRITVLIHHKNSAADRVRIIKNISEISDQEHFDVIINLAGANISKRWTQKYKKEIIDSRISTTQSIVSLIARMQQKPELLISASAIGYYGQGVETKTAMDEQSRALDGFTHQLCSQWEHEAQKAESYGLRTCITRLGVVLGKKGGALQKMLPAFKFCLGGRIGNGEQFFSWIHINDLISVFDAFIKNKDYKGIYNLTSPQPVTNAEFSTALSHALKRPAILPLPAFLVKLLLGEMGENLLLSSMNILPKRLQESGFIFHYPTIDLALKNICE